MTGCGNGVVECAAGGWSTNPPAGPYLGNPCEISSPQYGRPVTDAEQPQPQGVDGGPPGAFCCTYAPNWANETGDASAD